MMKSSAKPQKVSRRNLLQFAGISALSLAASGCQSLNLNQAATMAQANLPTMIPDNVAVHRVHLGAAEITIIRDGVIALEASMLGVNAPEGAVDNLLASYNIPFAPLSFGIQAAVVKMADKQILLDTGSGDFDGLGSNVGRLSSTLTMLGIAPDTINSVIITHLHPDHIAGASLNGSVSFPNAQYYLPQSEWDFLQRDLTGTPLDGFIQLANGKLEPIIANDQLNFYSDEDEIVSGIQAVAAPGHTPGHYALLITSENQQLFYLADTVAHSLINFERPDWAFAFDTIPEMAAETRRQLLSRAADEQMQIFTTHLPFPGLGYVSRTGDAFRYMSVT